MFIEWPRDPFVRHLESRGHAMRRRLGLNHDDALNPDQLISTFENMRSCNILDFASEHKADLEVLRFASDAWSAIAFRIGSGPWLISSNPWHKETRVRISKMEEVSHIVLEHRPTSLTPCPFTGLPRREYSKSKEKEAYGVAGAALVPYNGLVILLAGGQSEADIAAKYAVSESLVAMRVNVTKLRFTERQDVDG